MKKIALYCDQDHIKYKDSLIIAEKLQIKTINNNDLINVTKEYDYILAWINENNFYLAIIDSLNFSQKNKNFLYVDYINNLIANKKAYRFHYQDPLVKAMGLHKFNLKNTADKIKILDGTAGFTLDAFALIQLNNQINITMIENSAVIYFLVKDGLSRLELSKNPVHQDLSNRVQLYNNNLVNYLDTIDNSNCRNKFDIIYLDPMFEKQQKKGELYIKSKPKKNMQLLQDLCFNPNTIEELVFTALKYANNRVVLKRNIKQEKLFEKKINYSVFSKQIRYDVYLSG